MLNQIIPRRIRICVEIVNLESGLFTAQSEDNLAGNLIAQGGRGGPIYLALQPFYPGINIGKAF